jgi:hypothetical protein
MEASQNRPPAPTRRAPGHATSLFRCRGIADRLADFVIDSAVACQRPTSARLDRGREDGAVLVQIAAVKRRKQCRSKRSDSWRGRFSNRLKVTLGPAHSINRRSAEAGADVDTPSVHLRSSQYDDSNDDSNRASADQTVQSGDGVALHVEQDSAQRRTGRIVLTSGGSLVPTQPCPPSPASAADRTF